MIKLEDIDSDKLKEIIRRNRRLYDENVKYKTALNRILRMYKPETDCYLLASKALEEAKGMTQ